jgi:hypothetical protein
VPGAEGAAPQRRGGAGDAHGACSSESLQQGRSEAAGPGRGGVAGALPGGGLLWLAAPAPIALWQVPALPPGPPRSSSNPLPALWSREWSVRRGTAAGVSAPGSRVGAGAALVGLRALPGEAAEPWLRPVALKLLPSTLQLGLSGGVHPSLRAFGFHGHAQCLAGEADHSPWTAQTAECRVLTQPSSLPGLLFR